jgi:ABC-2 type transport system permease protein
MGKILGIAMVGLTQFLLWVVLTSGIVFIAKQAMPEYFKNNNQTAPSTTLGMTGSNKLGMTGGNKLMTANEGDLIKQQKSEQNSEMQSVIEAIGSINIPVMVFSFLFYFLGGYLLYAALFAAIGAAVDNEADTQQFMLPITIPLLFSILMIQFIINNPEGPIAFWFSMLPLTSPVIMMVRIPFGVPYWELTVSIVLLILTFIGTTWIAAKIYRTGILMYGKKVNYKELWKWLRYN